MRICLIKLIFILLMSTSVIAIAADLTTEQIRNVSLSQWPSFGRDYFNQRFSPSTQINNSNVSKLAPKWTYSSGVKATFQATPIVVNGIMYVSLPFNGVVALDASSGKEIWRYEHNRRADWKLCCGPSNRGVAVGYGKVFIGTIDARLIALNAKSGEKVWDIDVVENNKTTTESINKINSSDPLSKGNVVGSTGVGIVMAPVVFEGKVLIGITGVGFGLHIEPSNGTGNLAVIGVPGKYGRTGFLAAYNVDDGRKIWKFDTVPPKGWEGEFRKTTPDGIPLPRDIKNEHGTVAKNEDAWQFGGGSVWATPAIDSKLGLLYFGTGNPSPQMEDISRPGDNLYTSSLVALDINTGKLRWYYQQIPHDIWGYDVASPAVLFDFEKDGKKIPAVGQASKTGWLYIHNRENGELLLKSDAFVPQQNMFSRATPEGVKIYPGVLGGVNWSPIALDEKAGQAYVAAIHWPVVYTLHDSIAKQDKPAFRYTSMEPVSDERWGVLSSINLKTGHLTWQHKVNEPLIGGVLATAGNLIFTGESDSHFSAFNASDGKLLWQYKLEAGANAPPITYEIDGVQYIAIAAGGNQLFGFKQGDQLTVFALKN